MRLYKFLAVFIFGILLSLAPMSSQAQCPMCKMSAEQNLKTGGSAGKGLNKGILFMLAMPYVIVGTLGFYWIRNRRKEGEKEVPQEDF